MNCLFHSVKTCDPNQPSHAQVTDNFTTTSPTKMTSCLHCVRKPGCFVGVCMLKFPSNLMQPPQNLQSCTKVLRHFTETNAFKLTMIFCVWMKTSFSSVILPPFPQPMLQMPRGYLFASNIEKEGRGGYLSWGERGELTPREKRLVIVVCLNDVCPWLLQHLTGSENSNRF